MSDRDPVCVAHGCMQQRHFVSIRELQARIEELESTTVTTEYHDHIVNEKLAEIERLRAAVTAAQEQGIAEGRIVGKCNKRIGELEADLKDKDHLFSYWKSRATTSEATNERLRVAINDYLHCHADPPTEQMARAKLEQALKGVDESDIIERTHRVNLGDSDV